jgi:beta-mannosidase
VTSRFAAELGWQAPARWPVLVTAIGGEPDGADDARLGRLQKAYRGRESLARGVRDHLPEAPTDGRGWYLATQLVQARAVRAGRSHARVVGHLMPGEVVRLRVTAARASELQAADWAALVGAGGPVEVTVSG